MIVSFCSVQHASLCHMLLCTASTPGAEDLDMRTLTRVASAMTWFEGVLTALAGGRLARACRALESSLARLIESQHKVKHICTTVHCTYLHAYLLIYAYVHGPCAAG